MMMELGLLHQVWRGASRSVSDDLKYLSYHVALCCFGLRGATIKIAVYLCS